MWHEADGARQQRMCGHTGRDPTIVGVETNASSANKAIYVDSYWQNDFLELSCTSSKMDALLTLPMMQHMDEL
jgi:hypothetical protein